MKNAFITGANVGQANLLAKRLSSEGWRVFAGVLPGAPTDLVTGGNLTVVDQDVSSDESVKQSAEIVKKAIAGTENEGLDLLMNVAGVANIAIGAIEGADMEQTKRLFDINTFGQMRNVQAFLPLLRKNAPGSRIANYTSGAMIANPVGSGVYNMTKHAVHGMTMTLRHEMAPFGVEVTSIVPGGVLTDMSKGAHEKVNDTWHQQSQEILDVYNPKIGNTVLKVMPDMVINNGATPEEALEGTMVILAKKKWKPMELLGKDVKPMGLLRLLLSDSMLEKMMRSAFKIPTYKG